MYVTFARQVINYQGCESVYETADLSNYKLRLDDICVGYYAPLEFSGYIYQSLGMPQYKPEIKTFKNRVIKIIEDILVILLLRNVYFLLYCDKCQQKYSTV